MSDLRKVQLVVAAFLLGLSVRAYCAESRFVSSASDLGRVLFFDKRLSKNGSISCGSCHRPELYFQDGLRLSRGIKGLLGTRNAPSLITATLNTSQFWDGRRGSLEQQALDPLVNPREHGLPRIEEALMLLRQDSVYANSFKWIYGRQRPDDIQADDVRDALAAYQRTLVINQSSFDAFAYQGNADALSASAQRGLALFKGRAQCSGCHSMDQSPALFSDNQFHSLSVGLARVANSLPTVTRRLLRARQQGKLDSTVLSDEELAALGRFVVTLAPADIGKFRTPSLRNVAMTAPYMHDGSITTLEEAVDLEVYYRSTVEGRPLILTPAEKADLVEFLKALTTPLDVVLRQAGLDPDGKLPGSPVVKPPRPSGKP